MIKRGWLQVAAVFTGGMLGTAMRALLLDALGHDLLGLALINLLGCLLLGCVAGWFGARHTWLRTFLGVGCIASFTSWSSLALQGLESFAAIGMVVTETLLGIGVAGLGQYLGQRLSR